MEKLRLAAALTGKDIEKWAPASEADLPAEVQSLIAYPSARLVSAFDANEDENDGVP